MSPPLALSPVPVPVLDASAFSKFFTGLPICLYPKWKYVSFSSFLCSTQHSPHFCKKKHNCPTSLDLTENSKLVLGASIFLLEDIHCLEWNAVKAFSRCYSHFWKLHCSILYSEYFLVCYSPGNVWCFSWTAELFSNKKGPKQEGSLFQTYYVAGTGAKRANIIRKL